MLTEVLQGFTSQRDFNRARAFLLTLDQVQIVDHALAVQSARNFRTLRAMGVTVRKTIDVLIATLCIEDDIILLQRDRDFGRFEQHLGLRVLG